MMVGSAPSTGRRAPQARVPPCGLINPEMSRALRGWDFAMFGALVIVAVVTPFEVAFLENDRNFEALTPLGQARFWLNRTIDLIFIIDMMLQFFIMYPVPNKHGVTYVKDFRLIARHYISGWFWVDLFSILPFDIVGNTTDSDGISKLRLLKVVRLLRLLKLVRLFRGMRIIQRWQLEMSFSYRRMTQWQLLFTVCVAAHWISCFLGLVGTLCGLSESDDCENGWFSQWMASEGDPDLSPFGSYLVTLHVAATIIVHPHAGKPASDFERVCFILLIFIGGFIWTRIISRTTAMQTSLDRHTIFYKQTMDDLNSNSHALGLSSHLQRRLRGFFIASKDELRDSTWRDLTRRMSPALQADVSCELHRAWLRRIPYLAGASKIFILHLAPMIRTMHFAQNELFGDNFTLYILKQGLCGSGEKKKMKVLMPGSVWGMEHLLLNMWYLLRPNTARALSYAEMMTLTREDFWKVCKDHPENREKLRKYYVRYAVTRGIIFYAQQRREEGVSVLEHQTRSFESHGAEQYNHHIMKSKRELTKKTKEWTRAAETEVFPMEMQSENDEPRISSPNLSLALSSTGREGTGKTPPALPPVLLGKSSAQEQHPLAKTLSLSRSSRTSMAHLSSIKEPEETSLDVELECDMDDASQPVAPESDALAPMLAAHSGAGPALEATEARLSKRIEDLSAQVAQLQATIQLLVEQGAAPEAKLSREDNSLAI